MHYAAQSASQQYMTPHFAAQQTASPYMQQQQPMQTQPPLYHQHQQPTPLMQTAQHVNLQHQQQQPAAAQHYPAAAAAAAATVAAVLPTTILKQVDRASKVAWCPSALYPNVLASGTSAGTIDDSFESKSQLELYDIDLKSTTMEMKLIGAVQAKDCFHSIAWGPKGLEDKSYTHGLLAGGMSDGSVNLWNVASIINHFPVKGSASASDALLSRSDHHKGQVLSLQFHPSQPNLLCSGATDGEVIIWDLADPRSAKPSRPSPSSRNSQQAQNAVTSVSWNKKSFQILASSDSLGETTIWDLRQKRSIITLRNSSRIQVRTQQIAWNPDMATQLAVVYANTPVGEIWDLRQSMQPKQRLDGFHTGSLLATDWCCHDATLLLTTGEDGRIGCWNTSTGQFLTEYASPGVCFDIQFSPARHNLFSTCTYDGKVSIHTLQHAGESHVPKWMFKGKTAGCNFGFGGKLASFSDETNANRSVPSTPRSVAQLNFNAKPAHKVSVQQLVSEPQVIGLAQKFQQVIESNTFIPFCNNKIQSAQNEDEKVTWTFMRILFEDERNQRFLLLKELGFEAPANSEVARAAAAAHHAASAHNSVPVSPQVPDISEEEFFNQSFASPTHEPAKTETQAAKAAPAKAQTYVETYRALTAQDEDEAAIREALVFGDFTCAVEKCLASGRLADAIIFSSFGPPQLWESTKQTYFNQHKHPFIKNVMRAVSQQSLNELVSTAPLSRWKETLAILITYTTADKYRESVNTLGQRLEDDNKLSSAIICYMCSSNVDKSVAVWSRTEQQSQTAITPMVALLQAIEKIAVFAHGAAAQLAAQSSALLSVKYSEYASMLASQGFLLCAWNYLRIASAANANDVEAAILLDRIYHSAAAQADQMIQAPPPPFPFPAENVGIDPNSAVRQQQIAQIKQQLANRVQHRQTAQQQPQMNMQQTTMQQAANPYTQATQQPFAQQQQQTGFQQPMQSARLSATQSGFQQSLQQTNPYASSLQQQQAAQSRPPFQQPGLPVQPQQQQFAATTSRNSFGSPAANPYQQPTVPAASAFQAQPQFNTQPQAFAAAQATPAAFSPVQQPVAYTDPNPYTPSPQVFQPPQPTANGFLPTQQPAAQAQPTIFTPSLPSQQPSTAAAASTPSQPAAPLQPPKVPQQLTGEQQALYTILEQCCQALVALQLKGAEGKKVQDIQQRLKLLHNKLSFQNISPTAISELTQLSQCVARQAYTEAQKHHLQLVKTDWTNNNDWLLGLKSLLVMAKKYLGGT